GVVSGGVGVRSLCRGKRSNDATSPGKPTTINRRPTARVACRSKNGGRNSQRVIHHEMSPAKTVGATTKKRAEPRMAIVIVRLRLRRSRGVGSLCDPSILRLDDHLLDDGAGLLGLGAHKGRVF